MAFKLSRIIREGIKNPSGMLQLITNLPGFIKLIFRLFGDSRVPLHLKGILIFALIYTISPFDLIPDFLIPIIGQIDDIIVLILASKYFLKNCPPDVVEEHVQNIQHGDLR